MQVNKNIHLCDTFEMAAIFQNIWFGLPCLLEFFPGGRLAGAFPRGSSPRRSPPPCPPPRRSCCFTVVHIVNEQFKGQSHEVNIFLTSIKLNKYTVIRFVRYSAKFGTCTVVSVYGSLVENKMRI
jgi:hypothetical protein